MEKFIEYLKASKAELTHVSWPTRNQTIAYTIIVIVVALLIAGYIAILDYGFSDLIKHYILHS